MNETAEERKFVCQIEDQEIAKSGSKKWKIQEESAHCILWRREGSNKIEKSESSVSMQGQIRLYRQSFEEMLQSDARTGWMTGSCTVKNICTTWVRGCWGTSWKTWGIKYSSTKTVKDHVHGKTKYSRTNRVKKNSCQFAFKILYNALDVFCSVLPQQRHDSF